MKILFGGYRAWAINAFTMLKEDFPEHEIHVVTHADALSDEFYITNYDVVMLAGWSWKVPAEILNKVPVVGMHPSDLPHYAGGSPIQNQILDGVEHTNASLFLLTEKFDEGPVISKVPLSLEGHMTDIFVQLTHVTLKLFSKFIESFPENIPPKYPQQVYTKKRRKPNESKLTPEHWKSMTCKEMYNFIRCREDPYPNVYMEDETGRLVFKLVEFEKKR